MHWGIRRFQPYPDGNKKGKYVGDKKNKQRISYDQDVVIKKGTKAYRISANRKDTNDFRYLTVDQNDRNFYKAMWPSQLKKAGKDVKIYEQKYKLKEDLVSPSAKKREEIAVELLSNKETKQAYLDKRAARVLLSHNENLTAEQAHDLVLLYRKNNDKNLKEFDKNSAKYFDNVIKTGDNKEKSSLFLQMLGESDVVKKLYGQALIEKHYNMVIDDHGADFPGLKQRVNAPIIVLKNVDNLLTQIGSKKISDYDSAGAGARYLTDIGSIPGNLSERGFVPNVLKEAFGSKNYYDNNTYKFIYDEHNKLK